jgi:acyl-coenzyme A thioesterase PaaI-like protein
MTESWKIRLIRWRFNWYPAFRRSGARVEYISEDMHELRIRLPLNRSTRNLHGTIYGGAMYSAVDPLHAVLVARHMGPDFHVWMKSARIDFRRPGRGDLFAHARVSPADIAELHRSLELTPKIDRDFSLQLTGADGVVSADVTLTVHIRRRAAHEQPMQNVVFQT